MAIRPGWKSAVSEYVARCVGREETPRISEFARELDLTPEHLSRTFHEVYGVTLSRYMKTQQIRCAARMLRETDMPTTRIAYLCGFGTRRTFFRAFRQRMGLSPDAYRRKTA